MDYNEELKRILSSVSGDTDRLLLKSRALIIEADEDEKHYLRDVANLDLALTFLMLAQNAKDEHGDVALCQALRTIALEPENTKLIATLVVAQYQTVLAKRLVDNG